MKKAVIIIVMGSLFISTTFTSCKRDNPSITENGEKTYILSKSIIEYDTNISKNTNKNPIPLGKWETMIDYAIADGASAWTVFKVASKIVGLGYGAAVGMLGGVCGSIYKYVREHKDFKPSPTSNGNIINFNASRQLSSATNKPFKLQTISVTANFGYNLVGELHNKYLDSLVVKFDDRRLDIDPDKTYNYLCNAASVELNIPTDSIKSAFSLAEYNEVIDLDVSEKTNREIYDYMIRNNVPKYLCSYMNEFFERIRKPENASYDIALNYVNLFIEDVQNQSFTTQEKNGILYSLSIFKNSLQYWNQKL
jgi:hypothetical protein